MKQISKTFIGKYKMTLSLLVIFFICGTARSQQVFSDQVVHIEEDDFMPYTRGEVLKTFVGDFNNLMEEICTIISSWDSINPPKGFRVDFSSIQSTMLEITFSSYIKEYDERIVKRGPVLYMSINNPSEIFGTPIITDIFLQPAKVSDFYGYPVYQNVRRKVTVIMEKEVTLSVPVTREEYLNELLNADENHGPDGSGSYSGDDVLVEMEKAYGVLLKIDQAAAAEFKTGMDNYRSDLAQQKLEGDPEDLHTSLIKELEKLSPEERKSPAYYALGAMDQYGNLSGLLPSGHEEEGEALVRINPVLKNVVGNNTTFELLVISWYLGKSNDSDDNPRLYSDGNKGFMLADYHMAELYKQQDLWNKIFDLLKN